MYNLQVYFFQRNWTFFKKFKKRSLFFLINYLQKKLQQSLYITIERIKKKL